MKILSLCIFIFLCKFSFAQELFTFSEPASNMAAKSIGLRFNNYLMQSASGSYFYNAAPEVMIGFSKNLMTHTEVFWVIINKRLMGHHFMQSIDFI